MPTIEQLVTIAEVNLLRIGGVDNWEWYSDAMSDYVASEDAFEDAENYLSALQSNGIDGWDWYGESLSDLSEYEEYLNSLPSLDNALDVFAWQNEGSSPKEENNPKGTVPVAAEPAREKNKPNGTAAEAVYTHIANKFGPEHAEDIFDLAVEKGLWKQNTFPKEFKLAIKEIKKDVKDPLEVARQKLVTTLIKNGKLDIFLRGIV